MFDVFVISGKKLDGPDYGDNSYGAADESRAILYHSENQKSVVRIRGCDESNPHDLRMFALECATMSQFYHPNVLMMHGVAYDGPRVYMCLEEVSHGGLDGYLKACFADGDGGLTQLQLVHLLRGVACGMQYLTELGYVHKVRVKPISNFFHPIFSYFLLFTLK